MPRPAAAALASVLVAALALGACKKQEDVVVAAPVAPAARAGHAAPAPGPQAGELPPGHPPLGAQPGDAPPPAMGDAPPPGMPDAPPHGGAMSRSGAPADDAPIVKVSKASGKDAKTVAELFAQRAALRGKAVTVRGKVVKYNPGIMGKNWIHLRDGSGAAGKDDDVTVTTQDAVTKGDVIVVHGTVAVDQDIGMGSPYPVIIQDAKVTK